MLCLLYILTFSAFSRVFYSGFFMKIERRETMFIKIVALLLVSLVCGEPPVQNYNYNPTSGFGLANSYLPPRTGNPSNSYLPSDHSPASGPDYSQSSGSSPDYGHGHDHEVPKSYEFGYSVKDSRSGNDYGRREKSDGHEVRGEYRVFLPDGRTQIVTYHADWKTGFHADVRYEGEATYPNNVQGGYNYNAPTDFSGSLTGFHGNDVSKQTVYGQISYY
ncbi:PREDICTED: pro-resilin-like [Papilio xuthus]|uniref:Pro-resilin-like n=1 Tax=Papilio xuthus TaxID=66420 RepID=A0AAJ6ZT30_PAPXU|nr:PREDICTED: pro-resilin-like [Papilio xuthus]